DAFAAYLLERKGLSIVVEGFRKVSIFEHRMVALRPKLVKRQPPEIGMIQGRQTEQIMDFALEQTRQIPSSRQRRKEPLTLLERHRNNDKYVLARHLKAVSK